MPERMKIVPVILSGGTGSRLWPVSRANHPKQLQNLCGTGTLLQQTAARLQVGGDVLPPIVVCGEEQRFLVAEQLREAGIAPGAIFLEPVARSTGPALCVAALSVKEPERTILAAMPADHYIADPDSFAAAIKRAARLAEEGRMMTLGVSPTSAYTGFGYIRKGKALPGDPEAFASAAFKEKPDEATARSYLESGDYFWNAGLFVFRADAYLAEVARLQPAMLAACRAAVEKSRRDLDFIRLDEASFAAAPALSVDYGLMEQAENVGVLPISFEWSDIGGWAALWRIGKKDASGNVIHGQAVLRDTKHCYIRGEDRVVTAIGLENMAVVDTADALFIAPMDRADEVRDIVALMEKEGRRECRSHRRVWRPWGYYERLDSGERFQVKQIMIKPGARLSLQKHSHRAEHWIVVSGMAKATCGEKVLALGPSETAYIPPGAAHRLENPGREPLYLIEVQSGDYLGEDDIERIEDDYRR